MQLGMRLKGTRLLLHLRNSGPDHLNEGCGADFVQKERCLPRGFSGVSAGARFGA